jgi:flagellar assembly factor FliW
MKVETTRFGALEVDDSALISMPSGMLGFEHCKQFILLQHKAGSSFNWFQSAEEPTVAFVVVDPVNYFADYEVEISDSDVEKLHITDSEDASVFVILTIKDEGKDISANLAAPIIVNFKEQLAAQVVLQNERYSTQHSLITPCAEQKIAA